MGFNDSVYVFPFRSWCHWDDSMFLLKALCRAEHAEKACEKREHALCALPQKVARTCVAPHVECALRSERNPCLFVQNVLVQDSLGPRPHRFIATAMYG